ncbi:Acg family FMN-binding oxidoreductase [Streptomyces sp. YIM S03343]
MERSRVDDKPVGRRRVIGMVGLTAGAAAVAGAGGLTWRAVEEGVFATGTGPAYAAWDRWNPPGREVLNLVRAGVLAASAHNTQPWLFRVGRDQIDLYADLERGMGSMDPLRREMHLSLGCALENVVLAGLPNGRRPTVVLMPDPARSSHVARISLSPAPVAHSPLFAAVPKRHTNRGAYDTGRPLSADVLAGVHGLIGSGSVRLLWLTTEADKRVFGELTVRATEAIIADPRQAADDYAWYRTGWQQIQSRKDGITIDASGQPPLIRAAAKLLGTSRKQNQDGWLRATRDSQVATAAAFGILMVRDRLDAVQRLETGRIWQRTHLWATTRGLGVQPLNQVLERIDREDSAGLTPRFTDAMARLVPKGWHPLMAFRIGRPTVDVAASPRRPAEDAQLT